MTFRCWFVAGLLVASTFVLTAGGNKSKGILVTVHLEAPEEDYPKFAGPAKLGSESRQYFFRKIPEYTDDHIAWFYPFVSQDGKSFGAAFKLKETKIGALRALTTQHQGKLLGIRIPNAPYNALLIDKPIDDGILVFWEGLSKVHLEAFEKKFPHVDDLLPGVAPVPPPAPGANFPAPLPR